jgi:hypothetical protein
VTAGDQDGNGPTRKQLCAKILAQIRNPVNREETALNLEKLPHERIVQVTLEFISTSQEYFLQHAFRATYGDHPKKSWQLTTAFTLHKGSRRP